MTGGGLTCSVSNPWAVSFALEHLPGGPRQPPSDDSSRDSVEHGRVAWRRRLLELTGCEQTHLQGFTEPSRSKPRHRGRHTAVAVDLRV